MSRSSCSFRTSITTALLAALLLAASTLQGQQPPATSAGRPAAAPIDSQLAVATFDSAWTRIANTYFDTSFGGLDWPAVRAELRPAAAGARTLGDLRRTIDEMLGRLRVSHFVLMRKELLAQSTTDTSSVSASDGDAGMELRSEGSVPLVWRVRPGGPAAQAGISPGWRIDSIGSLNPGAALVAAEGAATRREQRLLRIDALGRAQHRLVGDVGDTVVVFARDARDAPVRRAVVLREGPGSLMKFGSLPPIRTEVSGARQPIAAAQGGGCVGIVSLSVWLPAAMPRVIAALDSVRDCRGIILDLRGNPGGVAGMSMGMAGYFLNDPVALGTMRTRTGELRFTVNPRRTTAAGVPTRPYDRPLAILVDEMSASTSEIFAGGMQALGRAVVIGDTTAGQALPAMVYSLPTGDVLMHAFGDFTAPDGSRLEGRGVIPDVVIRLRRTDLLAGRDAALDAAISRILSRPASDQD